MIIKTLNSIYEVKTVGDKFAVTRVEDISDGISTYNKVGETRMSTSMFVTVGYRATFDGWGTSQVVSVEI